MLVIAVASLRRGQRRARAVEIGRRIDAERRERHTGAADAHAGFQRAQLFQAFAALQRRFDIANELLIEGTEIAGSVREPVLGREAKLAALRALAADRGLPLVDTLAVGDGANDLPMLEAAGLGIAFHGKPAVVERARHRIDHADLTALLYVQGYREREIRR